MFIEDVSNTCQKQRDRRESLLPVYNVIYIRRLFLGMQDERPDEVVLIVSEL